ncbi:MAG: thiamine pyrophosphate-dependent enzyme [Pirellulales bacterium]
MATNPRSRRAMPLAAALEVLAARRRNEIVVTTMGSAREWPRCSKHALDFHYLPSAMGHAPMLGLGLALARGERDVIVLNGDGCMLMSLGCLVTVVASAAANYTLVVLDNGIYEVTGGQATPAGATDFAAMARAAGFATVAAFDDLARWQSSAAGILAAPGPRFISLRVEPVGDDYQLPAPRPMSQRIAEFRQALAQAPTPLPNQDG